MNNTSIGIHINNLAGAIRDEINTEQDADRNCRLQDVQELLRRAFHLLNQIPYEPNDLISDLHQTH